MFKKLFYWLVWLTLILGVNFIWWWVFAQQDVAEDVWINSKGSCLTGMWQWCMSYDTLIWGKDSQLTEKNKDRTVMTIAQDVVLSATYMVWSVLTFILLFCWLMYIFASGNGKDPSNYKKWLIRAGIWAFLVRGAYAIVRLIQYIAKW